MKLRIALLIILFLTASTTFAGSISINFGEKGSDYDRVSLDSGTNYGVVPVDGANWNTFDGKASSSAQTLKNEAGTTTGATVTWTSPNTYRVSGTTPTTADARLFWSYLDDSSGNTVTVANVPYEIYGVYIYASSDYASSFSSSKVNSTSYTFNTTLNDTVPGALTWGDGGSSKAANATAQLGKNYMIVSDQTNTTMVLYRYREQQGSNPRGCTSAIQIVNALPDDYSWTKTDAVSVSSLTESTFNGLKVTFPTTAATATLGQNTTVDILKIDGGAKNITETFTTGSNTLTFAGEHKALYANSLAVGTILNLQGTYSGDFTLYGVGDINTVCTDNGLVNLQNATLNGTVTLASGVVNYESFTAKNSNLVFDGGGVYFNSDLTIANSIKVDSSMAFRVSTNKTINLDGKYLEKATETSAGLIRHIDGGTVNFTGTPGSFNGIFQNETYTTNFQAGTLNGTAMNVVTTGGTVNIADTTGYTGTITATGGTTNVTSHSSGTLAVTGGTMNLKGLTGGNLQLSGGTLNLTGSSFATTGSVTATGGTMNLSGLTGNAAFNLTSGWGTTTFTGTSDYSVLTGTLKQTGTSSSLNFNFASTTLTNGGLPKVETTYNSSNGAYSNVNVLFPNGLTSGTLDVSNITGSGRLVLGTASQTQNLTITGTANTQFLVLNSVNATAADGAVLTGRQIWAENGGTLTLNDGSGFRASFAAATGGKYVDILMPVTVNNATNKGIICDVSTGTIYTSSTYDFGGTGDIHIVGGGVDSFSLQGPTSFTGTIYVDNGTFTLYHKNVTFNSSNKVILGNGITGGQLQVNNGITQTFDQVEIQGPRAVFKTTETGSLTVSSLTRTNPTTALYVVAPSTSTVNLPWNYSTVSSTTGAAAIIPNAGYSTGDDSSIRVATVVNGKVSVLADADHYSIATGNVDVTQATGKDILVSGNTNLTSDLTARSLNTSNDFLFTNNGSTLTLTSGTVILRGGNFWVKNGGKLKSSYSSDGGKTTDFYVVTTGAGTDKAFHNVSIQDYSETQPTNLIRTALNNADIFKLYSDQAYTGYTQVNSGTLYIGRITSGQTTASAKLQTSDFRVMGNGTLTMNYEPAHEIYSVAKGGTLNLNVGTDAKISAMNGSGGTLNISGTTAASLNSGTYTSLSLNGTSKVTVSGPQNVTLESFTGVSGTTLNLQVTNAGAPTVDVNSFGASNAASITVTASTNALFGNYDLTNGYTLTNTPALLVGATAPTGWTLDSQTAVLKLDSTNALNGGNRIPVGGTFMMETHDSLGWAAFESTEGQNAVVTLTLETAATDSEAFASWLSDQWGTTVTAVDSTTYSVPLSFMESPVLAWDLSKYTAQSNLSFASGSSGFVPEPAAWLLLLIGAGFLYMKRMRKG